jgi:CRP-like cAMP-binding protein
MLQMNTEYREILTKLINKYYSLSHKDHRLIMEQCKTGHFAKQEHLVESGQKEDSEYFLLDGIVHRYTLVEKGEFVTTGFYMAPAIITPNFARISNGKSILSLQALAKCTVAQISVKDLDELRNSKVEIRKWGQKVVEFELKKSLKHDTWFRSSSAKERLVQLRKDYQNLENSIPHTCIASYIGITPVSFSRLRKEMSG